MKLRWLLPLIAIVPVGAALLALQSCGGVGGPAASGGGGGTTVTQAFLDLLPDAQKTASYIGALGCVAGSCHGGSLAPTGGANNPDDPIYSHWKDTVHATKGVTCERCHGPGSTHASNPSKDNILTFPKSTSAVVCAQCHGPTVDEYNHSAHTELVTDVPVEVASNPGTYGRNLRCIVCHSGLMRAQFTEQGVDPDTMTDAQFIKVANDTLSLVPNTANCVTCHNPHSKTGKVNADGEEKQLRHKTFNTDTSQIGPGTTPSQFTNFDQSCAECHNGRGANPADSALTTGTARPGMHSSNQFNMLMGVGGVVGDGPVDGTTAHATAPGQCSKCHMPGGKHTFIANYDLSCSPCHSTADATAKAESIKSTILNSLVSLRNRMATWSSTTFPGQPGSDFLWDYTTLISAEGFTPPAQNLVPIQVKRARYNYWFIIRSGDYGVHNANYAKYLLTVANANLDQINVPHVVHSSMAVKDMFAAIERERQKVKSLPVDGSDN